MLKTLSGREKTIGTNRLHGCGAISAAPVKACIKTADRRINPPGLQPRNFQK